MRGFIECLDIPSRIMLKVSKTNTCWLYKGALTEKGYGHTSYGRAHRVIYKFLVEEIPKGMHVLHKCDVRNCVNPDHLFLGTDKENKKDMYDKDRLHRDKISGKYIKTVNVNQEILNDNL